MKKMREIKIGFRFVFQSDDSTITETQVNNIIGVIINHTKILKVLPYLIKIESFYSNRYRENN